MQLSFDFAASYTQLSAGKLKLTVKASLNKGQTWAELWNAQDHMGEIDEDNAPEDVTGTGSISIPANYRVPGARFAFVFESAVGTGASAAIGNVDTIGGATQSSTAIKEAVQNALKNAGQFNNSGLAAGPDEGKTERRQATGWVDADVKTDETFIEAKTASELASDEFANLLNSAYYADAVKWAVAQGISGGMGNGRFSPDGTCTRGQSVTFLYRAAGAPAVSGSSFQDVPTSSYCADAVAWAVKNGITQGTGAGAFSPNGGCNRAPPAAPAPEHKTPPRQQLLPPSGEIYTHRSLRRRTRWELSAESKKSACADSLYMIY